MIKFTATKPINENFLAFKEMLSSPQYKREDVIKKAEELTSIKVHDTNTFSDKDLNLALETLVGRTLNNTMGALETIPKETKHIVLGHAAGKDHNWFFTTGERVSSYINKNIPKGEKAWVVACKKDEPRLIPHLVGEEIESQGQDRQKISFRKL